MSADRLPTLTTERVQLRWLTPADVPALFAIFGDAEVCRYWGFATLPDVDAAAVLLRDIESHFANGMLFQWGVAERALVNHAFGELNLHRLEADVDPRNLASIRLLERLGFQREGYLRERHHMNGEVQDAVLYGLLHHEWRSE
jgi:RimJ/RimL family protein N-acetyltransferase